jgi:hypothetical protein
MYKDNPIRSGIKVKSDFFTFFRMLLLLLSICSIDLSANQKKKELMDN